MPSASRRRLRLQSAAALALLTGLTSGVAIACAREATQQGTTTAAAPVGTAGAVAATDSGAGAPASDSAARSAVAGPSAGETNDGATSAGAGPTLPMKGVPTPAPVAGANSAAALAVPAIGPNGPQLAPGRGRQDAESFGAAIRTGTQELAAWPKGPSMLAGSLLPNKRIVAFYGNPHSKKMGVLGEYPSDQMLAMLDHEVARWKAADPKTAVQPALHLVTVVASGDPGKDGGWRRREDSTVIEHMYQMARGHNAILFLDIQAGHSTLQAELPRLLPFLSRPDVHLGIDPEFYMHYDKEGVRPSKKIGTMMASDVNYVVRTLDKLVADKGIPPKVLIVHRFTKRMVPDAANIRPTPRVQVVMHMDGWGPPWLKFDSYRDYVVSHPVQYTGFKLFFHNDTKKGDALITPKELIQLRPTLSYIQYQ
ncbi:MAG TPA: hypothetical protein VGD56_09130 [Gemmatirosa sp.]